MAKKQTNDYRSIVANYGEDTLAKVIQAAVDYIFEEGVHNDEFMKEVRGTAELIRNKNSVAIHILTDAFLQMYREKKIEQYLSTEEELECLYTVCVDRYGFYPHFDVIQGAIKNNITDLSDLMNLIEELKQDVPDRIKGIMERFGEERIFRCLDAATTHALGYEAEDLEESEDGFPYDSLSDNTAFIIWEKICEIKYPENYGLYEEEDIECLDAFNEMDDSDFIVLLDMYKKKLKDYKFVKGEVKSAMQMARGTFRE